ncbi:MAG: restriction endonuclease subunit S [Kluyvera sp.]|uniref:restriction endonuclease subunit S n=1 Tax=Kluyvera sp. TaxID=1538228 RepID=UPI003F3E10F1
MNDNVKQSVPSLRFQSFKASGPWEFQPLGKLAQRSIRKNVNSKITRVLTNSAEYGVVDQRDFFEKDIANQSNLEGYYVVEEGSYVYNPRISARAPVGPISKNKIGLGVMSPLYTVFKFNNSDNDFYGHYFKTTHWHHYMRQVSSTGARHDRMSINNNDFMGLPLPVPTVKEQKKIADCLSSLDDLLTAEVQKLDALKEYKKGMLQHFFPRKGENVPQLRFPEFLKSGDWTVKPFAHLFKIGNGRDYKHLGKGDIPVYGSGGYMCSVDEYLYDGESVCIGRKGTINNPMFLNGKFWTVDTLFYTHSFKECLPYFIFLLFQNINWLRHNEASGVPSLSKANIEKIAVAIPSLVEQQKISDYFSSLDRLLMLETQKLDKLKSHRAGLTQQLFPSFKEAMK